MRSSWNQLRMDCRQQLRLQSNIVAFTWARQLSAALACFKEPEQLLAALAGIQAARPTIDWPRHNAILTDVIRAARTPEGREWGFCLLWLQLEPGLDGCRRKLIRCGVDDAAATSFLTERLNYWIGRIDLGRQRAIAHDLLGDIGRDAHDEITREIRRQRRLSYLGDPSQMVESVADGDTHMTAERISRIRAKLVEVLGPSIADLVVAVDINGESLCELSARLGLKEGTVRRRLSRARLKLAEKFGQIDVPIGDWASRFFGEDDSSSPKESP